ncbi:MAG: hypothetical protein KDJ65_39880, partial [Anaerolineae bacterium]|nr:hypothetical protein [Anaerolineae bacterium]
EVNPEFSLNKAFGDQITLLGYDIDSGQQLAVSRQPSAENQQPNQQTNFTITLYWRADTVPTTDYTVFLHLRDAANQNVAQKDSPPVGGQYPTSLWDPGEIIKDVLTLPLDDVPPGRYTPVIGLYNFATGDRLPTENPANEIALKEIEIGD